MYNIRQYEQKDLPALVRIWNESVDAGEVVFYPASEEYLMKRIFNDPNDVYPYSFVAEKDGQVVGFIIGVCQKTFLPKQTHENTPGHLVVVFVEKAHRLQGIGKKLMATLEDAFRAVGKKTISMTSLSPIDMEWRIPGTPGHDHNNVPGVDRECPGYPFMEKLGFQDTVREVAMYLDLAKYQEPAFVKEKQQQLKEQGIITGRYDTKLGYDFDRMCTRVGSEYWRTGKKWCIYPMYDFAHPIGDALEGISHSLCSLEYEIHRPLYDWVVEKSQNMLPAKPRQIEFARLNLTQTVMSKRKLRALVEGKYVSGWDDPRMPTLSALRRRGYTAAAVRDFISRVGVAKADSTVDYALLEACVRDDLGMNAARAMAVLNPVKVVLTNWPEGEVKTLVMENHPDHPEMGTHEVTFGRELFIDAEDFMEVPAKKFQRMYPGFEVRLKGAYIVKCEGCTKDENGNVTEIQCTVDFDSASGTPGSERKIKGKVLHWVSAHDAVPFEARLYEPLLADEEELAAAEAAAPEVPEDVQDVADETQDGADEVLTRKDYDFLKQLNPNSLTVVNGVVEPCVLEVEAGTTYQFLRVGYFCKDPDSTAEKPVFNRTVGLRDTFAKQVKK